MPQGLTLPLALAEWSIGAGKISGTLVTCQGPCTVLLTKERLHSVEFVVLNFPLVFGGQNRVIWTQDKLRLLVYSFVAGPWQIEMTQVPDLEAIDQTLKNDGGYAVTYTGTCSRSDGEAFTIEDAERLLEVLRLFLSFARGAFCSVPLRAGVDANGNKIWEQWGDQLVDPQPTKPYSVISWFSTMHGEILPQVFPGFWRCLNDSKWEDAMRIAIYWYLRSNAGGRGAGIDGGLILSQAALERLSYVQCGLPEPKPKASDLIRKAFKNLHIPLGIPSSCQKLFSLAQVNNWQDGPHALIEVRNALVHPKQKYKDLSYFEAWNLSQYYIELMLLRLCEYKGYYANRLKLGRWQGEVEPVPWA